MEKEIIRISEVDAAGIGVATLLKYLRAGAEVLIENNSRPVAILRSAEPASTEGLLLSESIGRAERSNSSTILDGEFGRDLEQIINEHSAPLDPPAWD